MHFHSILLTLAALLVAAPAITTATEGECANEAGLITSTSIATVRDAKGGASLEDLVAMVELVEKARAFEGNISYELVQNAADPNEYSILEKWESEEALSQWKDGPAAEVFSGPSMKGVLASGELTNVQTYVTPLPSSCRDYITGTIAFDVESDCSVVWNDIKQWDNCNYEPGCEEAELKPCPDGSDAPYRVLKWGNGFQADSKQLYVNDDELSLRYTIFSFPDLTAGYTGDFKLTQQSSEEGGGCTVVYEFTNPKGPEKWSLDYIYNDMATNRIPFQQALYSVKK
jgi:quinol monooxygenase YgiN